MKPQPFRPFQSLDKQVTVSAVSQSVDFTGDFDLSDDMRQIRIVNTSTGTVAIKMGTTAATVTAAFSEGNGLLLPAGQSETFTRPDGVNRFAVIGASANGTVQIMIGTGY